MTSLKRIKVYIRRIVRFFTYDIWRLSGADRSTRRINLYNVLKAFILAGKNMDSSELNTRAAALTYKTLLSIVPLLAVLFAISQGFGFRDTVERELLKYFEGQADMISKTMVFIDNSLEYVKGDVFLGVGIVVLLYTVINLLSSIETNFNTIWRIKKRRTYYRQFTDYLALLLLAPVLLICNAGLSLALGSILKMDVISFVASPMIALIPFVLTIILFTFFYTYIPNTRVKLRASLLAGVFTGICFQIFQLLYINGQIWISKYNTIYGSFAALPLLLLWMQLSWLILLFGVELSFAFQNVNKFSFEHETKNISRRYKDFVLLAVTSLIVKRFETEEMPYTAEELSAKYKIPTRLLSDVLYYLVDIKIILEISTEDERVMAYVPAIDINQITISYLYEKVNMYGSEDFLIDTKGEFKSQWDKIAEICDTIHEKEGNFLVKDL